MKTVHDTIREAEQNYLRGSSRLGQYVQWNMHDTIEKIDAYLNSKHTSGETDSLGREKPFFNIVSAATNIWYRATDIDRKDIKFVPNKNSSVALAFTANVMLQNWMQKQRFGAFLNDWGRALARYGSAVVKFIEKDGDLIASVVPWNRYIADPVQFEALPHIEKFYLTPAQLRQNKSYNQDVVDDLLSKLQTRRTLDKQQKDNLNGFIELYEVHGELDSRFLEKAPDEKLVDKDIKYQQQMHIVSYIKGEGKEADLDFTLYSARETKDPYMITHLIKEDGRTLGIGAVEYLFDAQWMANHTVKNMKDTLDLASRLIFQTADTGFVGRNVLSAIETGDVLIHSPNNPLTRLANDKPDIAALQNFNTMWQTLGQELTSTPEAARGITPPSGIAMGTVNLVTTQGLSLFEIMTENKGLAIEDMARIHIIPHMKKQLKHKDEIVGVLDNAGITEIDSMYIPFKAVNRFNMTTKDSVLNGQFDQVQPFNKPQATQQAQQEMGQQGNRRFFTPDDIDEKTWSEVFSDFEWDSVMVEVTNEQQDKQAAMTTLSEVFKTVVGLAGRPMTSDEKLVFNKILSNSGQVSPMELSNTQNNANPSMPQDKIIETIAFKDLPPDAQVQMLEKVGIKLQPSSVPVGGGQGGLPATK